MPSPVVGLRSKRELISSFLAPSSTRATSRMRTSWPSEPRLTTTSRNSSSVVSRPSPVSVNWNACWLSLGGCATCPATICSFCSCSAATTSLEVKPRAASNCGFTQIRIE